jgi:hypothetical protein
LVLILNFEKAIHKKFAKELLMERISQQKIETLLTKEMLSMNECSAKFNIQYKNYILRKEFHTFEQF